MPVAFGTFKCWLLNAQLTPKWKLHIYSLTSGALYPAGLFWFGDRSCRDACLLLKTMERGGTLHVVFKAQQITHGKPKMMRSSSSLCRSLIMTYTFDLIDMQCRGAWGTRTGKHCANGWATIYLSTVIQSKKTKKLLHETPNVLCCSEPHGMLARRQISLQTHLQNLIHEFNGCFYLLSKSKLNHLLSKLYYTRHTVRGSVFSLLTTPVKLFVAICLLLQPHFSDSSSISHL